MIDQVSSGDRDTAMNDLLNQLDGNELKNVDVTFLFTTNNHDKIHPAMRRPGRIDQVVHFGYADEDMITQIFTMYAAGREGAAEVDYKAAAQAALLMGDKDRNPALQGAVIAEISRRAIEFADNLDGGVISTDRFLDAIASMEDHIQFMKKEQQKDHTAENLLGHLMYKSLTKAFPNAQHVEGFEESPYSGLSN